MTLGLGSLGAAAARIIQSGNNTFNGDAADILNEMGDVDLSRRDWGRVLESLKADLDIANDFHGLVDSLGNYIDPHTREVLGNLFDYLPGGK